MHQRPKIVDAMAQYLCRFNGTVFLQILWPSISVDFTAQYFCWFYGTVFLHHSYGHLEMNSSNLWVKEAFFSLDTNSLNFSQKRWNINPRSPVKHPAGAVLKRRYWWRRGGWEEIWGEKVFNHPLHPLPTPSLQTLTWPAYIFPRSAGQ